MAKRRPASPSAPPDAPPVSAGGAESRQVFRLEEARLLMPKVKRLTRTAVDAVERVQERIVAADEVTPEVVAAAEDEVHRIVDAWAKRIAELGASAKGLWLVDFDNGAGYFCWQHPETDLAHFHEYEAGFSGRTPIQ